MCYLLIDADSVEAGIHNVHPSIPRGEYKQRHQCFSEIVEIVFSILPNVSFVGQAVRLIAYIFNIRPVAVIKGTLEELHAQDTEDYEKSTAYQNDVADRS